MHFRKITVGRGFEWGKRKVRETRGKVSEVTDKVLAKCYGGQSRGVLTGEEKRVILRDAGGGKTQIWPLGKRHIYSGFTFVIHEVQSRRGVDRNAKHEMSLRSKSSHRTW